MSRFLPAPPPLVGLVSPQRKPMGSLTAALMGEAKQFSRTMLESSPAE
jgi:hypothetical protein